MTFFWWFWTFFSCFKTLSTCFKSLFKCFKTLFTCFRTCFTLLSLVVASELSVGLAVILLVIRLLHLKKSFTVWFCDKSFFNQIENIYIYISNSIQTHNQFEVKSKLNRIIIERINSQIFIFLSYNIDFIVVFPPKSCYQILWFRINSFSFKSHLILINLSFCWRQSIHCNFVYFLISIEIKEWEFIPYINSRFVY